MCYDISYQILLKTLVEYFGDLIIDDPQMELDLDIMAHVIAQAHKKYPVVIYENDALICKLFEWGLISKGMKTLEEIKKRRNSMCNAQSERIVMDKQSAWHGIRKQRCLIPVNGIFEHRAIKGWKNKVPYYVRLKDREMFCLPGLYNYPPIPQNLETGEVTGTYTLITRAANDIMKQIHNDGDNAYRMPLFLSKELETDWLDPNLTDEQVQEILNYEMPPEEMEYWPVYSVRTTKPHPAGGHKTDPFEWPNLPSLGNDDEGLQKALF